ncbi:MAG TPA: zinc-ribbon domain-containing protein [Tepidisphaeraceae bacterium]|jgi:ribosomal protein L40E
MYHSFWDQSPHWLLDMPTCTVAFLMIFIVILLIATANKNRHYVQHTEPRICRSCGQSHPPFAAFCRRCGTRL